MQKGDIDALVEDAARVQQTALGEYGCSTGFHIGLVA